MSYSRAHGKSEVSDTVIADLKKRFTGFAVPEGAFDPSTATAKQLQDLGLPPKPSSECQPLLREAWDAGFGKPLRLQKFQVERDLVEQTEYRLFERQVADISFDGINFETSSNWSGAYITANQDRQFLQVWGSWRIPGNLQMPPPYLQGPQNIPYVCANWIGLDGQRLYLNSSLPQMGTVSILQPNNTTTAQAWTQWWARGSADPTPVPLGLAVAPGDQVLCVVTAQDPMTVYCVMVNLTPFPPTGTVVKSTVPNVTLPDGTTVQPSIAGATAEWIVERPRVPNPPPGQPPAPYNFANYGEMEFQFCGAVEGNGVSVLSWFSGLTQVLRGARRIRMFDVLANPARTEFISMPRGLTDTSIRLKYGRF
jgi:hypothetical protein